jgi:NAD(P)-dependent dehydrogenase (short-subunit alcohol dehydrogenase family)
VTGGSSGLGFETALALARAGADVILAGRNGAAAHEALHTIRHLVPGVLVRFEKLDLARQQSVGDFASRLVARNHPIDLLVHCAGTMESAQRQVTADGFEMQLAVHYLGPFALTARLLPLLRQSRHPRVVQVSSLAHRQGTIDFDDLQLAREYEVRAAHCQSKLASLMFALELQRRSDAHGWGLLSVAAHPGNPGVEWPAGRAVSTAQNERKQHAGPSQTVSDGALAILFAATSTLAKPGGYYGPAGSFELAGPPGPARIDEKARDRNVSRRLWATAEQLTGVRWPAD